MSKSSEREYVAYLIQRNSQEVVNIIKHCPERSSSRRERWIVENLGSLECLKERKEDPSWFAPFETLNAFRYLFESRAEKSEYKEDIIRVYKKRLEQGYELSESTIQELLSNSLPKDLFDTEKLRQIFPKFSFALTFKFTLRRPYISRDDAELYVIDNPVRKDWVFKLPYIAPSQWKGALRAAIVQLLGKWWISLPEEDKNKAGKEFIERRVGIVRLFGNEKEVEMDSHRLDNYLDEVGEDKLAMEYRKVLKRIAPEGHRRGRLVFYPTFFKKLGLEVINPHDRKTGAGTHPIYLENVPAKVEGEFYLLYVPFDRVGEDEKQIREEMWKDISLVVNGLDLLFTEFGFGAKTSSGFGLGEEKLKEGKLKINLPEPPQINEELYQFMSFSDLKDNVKKIIAILQNEKQEVEDNA